MRSSVGHVNRFVALVLALIWACAGALGLVMAYVYGRWVMAIAALLALCYAVLWIRVAVEARLLTWSEIAAPWRAR